MKIIIIGGGIIGLATAFKLKNFNKVKEIIIIEKEKNSITHGTGRNSGVIHSGIYYPPKTLKAKLCISGAKQLKEYVKKKSLWIDECGKILVPTNSVTEQSIQNLLERGKLNKIDIELIGKNRATELEPNINLQYKNALYVPFTSLTDPQEVARQLIDDLRKSKKVKINYNEKIIKIHSKSNEIISPKSKYIYDFLINSAGLNADIIAKESGLNFNYSFLPFKGKYWKLNKSNYKLKRLVYPIPDLSLPFLGIHTAHNQSGEIFFGPSSTPVFGREEYKNLIGANKYEAFNLFLSFAKKIILNQNNLRNLAIKEFSFFSRSKILKEVSNLIKNVEGNDIKSYYSKTGIRSQIFDNHSKSLVTDFVVKKKDNQIHVLNAVSPAYTASFGFADYLVNQIS